MVVGWGKTSDYSDTASRLQYAETTIIQHEACTTYFPHITYAQLCVGGDPPIGPCNGDSGGPLVFNGKQVDCTKYLYFV